MTTPRAIFFLSILAFGAAEAARAQSAGEFTLGSHFTYRGHLDLAGAPADGRFDLTFELYDGREGGRLLGRIDRLDQEIRAGQLFATLDFGAEAFQEGSPWLEIRVRSSGMGPYTSLLPRQLVTRGTVCTVNQDVEINGDLTVSDGHELVVGGPLYGLTLAEREISVSPLWIDRQLLIQPAGGSSQVGIGVAQAEAPLSLPAGPDVTPSSGGALVVGPTSGSNIAIDANEIMSRSGGAVATLYLNPEGGNVQVGGPLIVGHEIVSNTGCDSNDLVVAVCSPGKRVVGGSCFPNDLAYLSEPRTIGGVAGRGWICGFHECEVNMTAKAVCANVR